MSLSDVYPLYFNKVLSLNLNPPLCAPPLPHMSAHTLPLLYRQFVAKIWIYPFRFIKITSYYVFRFFESLLAIHHLEVPLHHQHCHHALLFLYIIDMGIIEEEIEFLCSVSSPCTTHLSLLSYTRPQSGFFDHLYRISSYLASLTQPHPFSLFTLRFGK